MLVLLGITGLACATPPLAPTLTSAPTNAAVLLTATPAPHIAIKTVAQSSPTPIPPTAAPTAIPTPTPPSVPPTTLPTLLPSSAVTSSTYEKPIVAEGLLRMAEIDDFTRCALGRMKDCTMAPAIESGLLETGLKPRFPDSADCREIDDYWAMDYTAKRKGKEYYHGGIDMPAPSGTPIIASADGTVIGKFLGDLSPRGIEIVLRHSPKDTGLPFWTYTQYTHFSEVPKQEVGQQVRMGEILGPTGNSGIDVKTRKQSEHRRTAVHFAVFYNTSGDYAVFKGKMVIPAEGKWMDPNAMFRQNPPYDSSSLKELHEDEKIIPISIMFEDGITIPSEAKIVWPYFCNPL